MTGSNQSKTWISAKGSFDLRCHLGSYSLPCIPEAFVDLAARADATSINKSNVQVGNPILQVTASSERQYYVSIRFINGDITRCITEAARARFIGSLSALLIQIFTVFIANPSKLYRILVSAASTVGQLPTSQAKAVPVVFRLAEQYAAALYCAKRSRLSQSEVAIASGHQCVSHDIGSIDQ